MMKKIDLTNKTEQELTVLAAEQRKKLQDLSFDLKLGKLQNTSQMAKLRKDIARVKQALKQNFLSGQAVTGNSKSS